MESWRAVWRRGIVPLVCLEQLKALYVALRDDSKKLIQGATTTPPPLMAVADWPVEASDAMTYLYWQGFPEVTVGEAEEAFARWCFEIDEALGEPAACRWFLNWWDESPRPVVRRELLAEVEKAMELKKGGRGSYESQRRVD